MTKALVVDELSFEVKRSDRRRSMELIVDRDGELRVLAPETVSTELIKSFIRDKKFWLYTKLAEKESMARPTAGKEFVTGEGFPYLGRSYRLLLVADQDRPLKLQRGRFRLVRSEAADRGREHFIAWYTEHARDWLGDKAQLWSPRISVQPTGIRIQDLGFRWGSCGAGGVVNFHWATILLPGSIVEYVVVHELAHLHERCHTPEFWRRVERSLPDYLERKDWLARHGGKLMALA